VINLSADPNWKGSPDGLRIDPVMKSGVTLHLGWIRLTTANLSNVVTISWSGGASSSKTYVYVGKTCSLTDATPIGIVNTSAGKFDWGASLIPIGGGDSTLYPLPESFEPGSYKVFALENNTGNPSCSDVTIQKAPILEFQSPGYLSGPDYATTVVGNSWGMSGPEDISDTYDLHNQNFDNGIFTAVTGSTGDPRINLNVTQPIDTAKYKYATFRMYLEGTRDVGSGWIQRFLWWSGSPDLSNFGTTSDMIVYEGWHTYTINLSQAPLASGIPWTGTKNALRLDPDEVPGPVTVHLDYVTLTGDQVVNRGSIFPVIYQVTGSANSRITFYTDNDKNPGNGRTPATGTFSTDQTAQVQTNGGLKLFIPFINNHFPDELSNLLTGSTWNWNTAQTPAGTYYLSADVTDGVVTTTWYSDLPVTVR
jgi:hypothetical protein